MNKQLLFFLLIPFLGFSQVQIGQDIDGEAAGDLSGSDVSLSADGSILAIAPINGGNGSMSGHVRIYKNISGTWLKLGTDIDGKQTGGSSGNSVSISSDGKKLL